MTAPACAVPDCTTPARSRGWCEKHYTRWRRNGDPVKRPEVDYIARFWSKVDKRGPDECWPWGGTILDTGYGQYRDRDGRHMAHRYAYELEVGPIPKGLTIDHVRERGCTRLDCVNPAHLEPVTTAENNYRSDAWSGVNARKTRCPAGHKYDLIRTRPNGRRFRACSRCRSRK